MQQAQLHSLKVVEDSSSTTASEELVFSSSSVLLLGPGDDGLSSVSIS